MSIGLNAGLHFTTGVQLYVKGNVSLGIFLKYPTNGEGLKSLREANT